MSFDNTVANKALEFLLSLHHYVVLL